MFDGTWKEPIDDDALIQIKTSDAYDEPRAIVLNHILTYEDAVDLREKLRVWINDHTSPYGWRRNAEPVTEPGEQDAPGQ